MGNLSELANVIVWPSHILIRFKEAKNDEVAFHLTNWYSVLPPPTRARDEALRLAQSISETARKDPGQFAALAREYSEDITTRAQGGSFGGIHAHQFDMWPQVLDTFAALRPNEASEVVETWYGFHIFLKSEPPPEETVSGARLVIAHHLAGWLPIILARDMERRTRTEALAFADDLYAELKQHPEKFAEFVTRHSDDPSVLQGGDFGSWSTRELTQFPREVEVLRSLKVGEVAPPIDSISGFEIIQRTPHRPRRSYAMTGLWLAFDATAPDGAPSSRAAVQAEAAAIANGAAGSAERFEALSSGRCCRYAQQWEEGRGTPELAALLDQLRPGEVGSVPVQTGPYYVVVQRVEPVNTPVQRPQFELPAPDQPNLSYHLTTMPGAVAREHLQAVRQLASQRLQLSPTEVEQFEKLDDISNRLTDELPPEARLAALDELVQQAKLLLGGERFGQFQDVLNTHFRDYILSAAYERVPGRLPSSP